MKVVINKCFGGFGLSMLAIKEYLKQKGKIGFFYDTVFKGREMFYKKINEKETSIFMCCFLKDMGELINGENISQEDWDEYCFSDKDIDRTDENLIKVIRKLGDEANSRFSELKIVEIPDDIEWEIEEYDGQEWIAEKHETWG